MFLVFEWGNQGRPLRPPHTKNWYGISGTVSEFNFSNRLIIGHVGGSGASSKLSLCKFHINPTHFVWLVRM